MVHFGSTLVISATLATVYANVNVNNTFFNSTDITYEPFEYTCPLLNSSFIYNRSTHEGFIRSNYLISQDEYSYISARQVKATNNLIEFLDNLQIPDYNQSSFANYFDLLNQSNINIGLSFSGGGFRALLTGAGELMALDSRTTKNSTLKGLLDSSAYITGLSGGSILLSTLIFNNWTSVENIINDNNTSIWNMTQSPISTDISYWTKLLNEVSPKKNAGYDISLIDIFGRILSRYMFEKDNDNYGLNFLWSDIKYIDSFIDYDMPFPMIAATGGVDSNISDYSSNIFEINPFEFGSFSPYVGGFIPIEILGSQLDAGLPIFDDSCTFDFDNAGFLTGASSNILAGYQDLLLEFLSGNQTVSELLYENLGTNISTSYVKLLLNLVNPNYNETLFALIDNPFFNSSLAFNQSDLTNYEILKLADGGLFEEVIPLDPILVPSRELDIVFAFDNSAQTSDNWPNGESLFATEERWSHSFPNDKFYGLPSSPDEFVQLGLNTRPVFFGCNGSSLITNQDNPNATVEFNILKPLLVYIPNIDVTSLSNFTGYTLTYEERDAAIENGFEIVQFQEEDDFAQCIGCAIIRRSEERANIEISPFCAQCFNKYCFEPENEAIAYDNSTIIEVAPTSIYSSSALPSKISSLLSKKTKSVAFPTSFPKTTTA
jgi:lysophospholipase